MCVIVYKPKGQTVSATTLSDCHSANPDGIGIMYWNKGRVIAHKGLQFDELLGELDEATDEVVVHFRIATSGDVDTANCHPFAITHDTDLLGAEEYEARAAVVHNGIMPQWTQKGSPWCDTALFVSHYLAHIPRRKRGKALTKAAQKTGSKFAMMSGNGVDMYGNWKEQDGVWFSNLAWAYTWEPYYGGFGFNSTGPTKWTQTTTSDPWGDDVMWEYDDESEDDTPHDHKQLSLDEVTCPGCGCLAELEDDTFCAMCYAYYNRVGVAV